jgi:hypothetical protein
MNNHNNQIMGSIIIFIAAIGIIALFMWIGALIEIVTRDFKEPVLKILWFLTIFLFPIVGPLLYFLIGRPSVDRPKLKREPRPVPRHHEGDISLIS